MSSRPAARAARIIALVLPLVGCVAGRARTDRPPILEAVRPDSVQVAPGSVQEVMLIGSGFSQATPGENTVWFGASMLRGVMSRDEGRRITFAIPDAINSGGGAAPTRLVTGAYPIRVETAAGKSNELMLRVFR